MRFLNKLIYLSKQSLYHIFPYHEYTSKSKKVWARIEEIDNGNYNNNLQYVERLDGFKETEILSFYDCTLEVKKSLEEKAKSILFSVTVAITLMTTIFSNHDKFSSGPQLLTHIMLFMGIISVLYMVISAVMTLQLLSDKIQLYQLFPVDTALEEAEKVKLIAINTEQNVNMNIIRSNTVYIAHKSIINSLICLLILLLLFNINLTFGNQNKADDYNKLKADVAQISSKVKGIESNLMNNGRSTAKKIEDLLDKIQLLEYEIKKMENAQTKK